MQKQTFGDRPEGPAVGDGGPEAALRALLAAIEAEPVPERILTLARQLQDALDGRAGRRR